MLQELPKSFFLHALVFFTCWMLVLFHYENTLTPNENTSVEFTLLPAKEAANSSAPVIPHQPIKTSTLANTAASTAESTIANTAAANTLAKPAPSTPTEAQSSTTLSSPEAKTHANLASENSASPHLNNSFFTELRAALEAQKEYPATARSRHQSGRVDVSFVLTKTGGFQEIKIHHPSEFEKLNEAAMLTVNRLGHFRAIPDDISKTSMHLVIPIEFKLD